MSGTKKIIFLCVLLTCATLFAASKAQYVPRVYEFTAKYANIKGVNVCYIDEGAGDPAIIFVHGLSGSIPNYIPSVRHFSKTHRAIAVDLPGHGNSERRNDIEYGIPLFADTIAGLMDKLGIEKAIIAGESMGGHTTAYFAWKYPQKTIAAVLIDAAGLGTNFPAFAKGFINGHPEWIAKKMTAMTRKSAEKNNGTPPGGPDDKDGMHGGKYTAIWDSSKPHVNKYLKDGNEYMKNFILTDEFDKYNLALVKSAGSVLNTPMNDKLAEIRVPTLIVWGDRDTLVDIEYGHDYAKGIRGSYFTVIQNCGHVPPVEEPEQFFSAVEKFFMTLGI